MHLPRESVGFGTTVLACLDTVAGIRLAVAGASCKLLRRKTDGAS
jgi:hypothetical protein